MKPHFYFLLALLPLLLLSDPIGDLQTTASSSTVQTQADYQFSLTFNGDGIANYSIPAGS